MQKDGLIQFAKDKGLDVAVRWSKTDIIDALKKANIDIPEDGTQAKPPQDAKTAPVRLLRDYWDDDGNRHRQGAVINVDVTTAKALIGQEKAERADPLPGEA